MLGNKMHLLRRKLQAKVQEMQEALDAANNRIGSLEKARIHLAQELEDAQLDADKVSCDFIFLKGLKVVPPDLSNVLKMMFFARAFLGQ